MSDTSQGEGWWQASDLKWYPPETHPSYRPPPPSPPPVAPPEAASSPPEPVPGPAVPVPPASPPQASPGPQPSPAPDRYPPPTDALTSRRKLAAYLVAGAAALMVVGSFMPWAKVNAPFFGTISRTGTEAGDGWISVVIGGVLAVVAWRFFVAATSAKRAPFVLAIVLSVAALGLTVFEWVDIDNASNELTQELGAEEDEPLGGFLSLAFSVEKGAGLYAVGVGGLLGIGGALAYKQPPKD